MNNITLLAAGTTYIVSHLEVPTLSNLPWGSASCDAFIAILGADLLTENVMSEICMPLVNLPTEWVECLGENSEYVHDLIDKASVQIDRQASIGDGSPMTTWYEEMQDVQAMASYLQLGGQGATDNRIIVVIGENDEARTLTEELKRLLERKE